MMKLLISFLSAVTGCWVTSSPSVPLPSNTLEVYDEASKMSFFVCRAYNNSGMLWYNKGDARWQCNYEYASEDVWRGPGIYDTYTCNGTWVQASPIKPVPDGAVVMQGDETLYVCKLIFEGHGVIGKYFFTTSGKWECRFDFTGVQIVGIDAGVDILVGDQAKATQAA